MAQVISSLVFATSQASKNTTNDFSSQLVMAHNLHKSGEFEEVLDAEHFYVDSWKVASRYRKNAAGGSPLDCTNSSSCFAAENRYELLNAEELEEVEEHEEEGVQEVQLQPLGQNKTNCSSTADVKDPLTVNKSSIDFDGRPSRRQKLRR